MGRNEPVGDIVSLGYSECPELEICDKCPERHDCDHSCCDNYFMEDR